MSTINNTYRLTGLASGMDTDAMVQSMLASDQAKIDKIEAEKQVVEWQQEIYRDIISDIQGFQDKYFSMTSSDSLLSESNWNTLDITSSESSVVTATGSAGSASIDYNFEVENIATADTITAKIDDKNDSIGLSEDTIFKIKNGENEIEITLTADDTFDSMIKKINDASDGSFEASYSEMTKSITLTSNEIGAKSDLQFLNEDGSVVEKLGGVDFSKTEGLNAKIIVTDGSGNPVTTLNQDSNRFTIDGITYTVNSPGDARLTSTDNTTQVVENMKNFVDDYNTLMDDIYSQILQRPNSGYDPLTEDQKSAMSSEEITKWEEKAMEGLLRNDPDLRSFMDDMQKSILGDNTAFMLSIGIGSHSDYNKKGQLSFDEAKFTEALETNGDEVYKKLAGDSDSIFETARSTMQSYAGNSTSVFAKKAGISGTASVANNLYSQEITSKETKIRELLAKMTTKETNLFSKFAAMEKTMNSLNNQMAQFFQV
ncbi:MAG: flagellar filament capping protein FliD [Peptostreptococcaceae bacterium]